MCRLHTDMTRFIAMSQVPLTHVHTSEWRRLIGSPKSQIIFHKRATKYRALLLKMTYKYKGSYSRPRCRWHATLKSRVCDTLAWLTFIHVSFMTLTRYAQVIGAFDTLRCLISYVRPMCRLHTSVTRFIAMTQVPLTHLNDDVAVLHDGLVYEMYMCGCYTHICVCATHTYMCVCYTHIYVCVLHTHICV